MKNRILILDSDRALLNVLQESLHFLYFDVQVADEMFTFSKLYKKFNPDLVLMEFILPGINGGEICHRLKHMNSSVPVIGFHRGVYDYKQVCYCRAG